jgi:hypothetical protein
MRSLPVNRFSISVADCRAFLKVTAVYSLFTFPAMAGTSECSRRRPRVGERLAGRK